MNVMTAHATDQPTCINGALEIIGDKWTALLIKEMRECPKTFSELEDSLMRISPRTLSQRLDKLESEDIIVKMLYCEHPPRFKYALTPKGLELRHILDQMAEWGHRYAR